MCVMWHWRSHATLQAEGPSRGPQRGAARIGAPLMHLFIFLVFSLTLIELFDGVDWMCEKKAALFEHAEKHFWCHKIEKSSCQFRWGEYYRETQTWCQVNWYQIKRVSHGKLTGKLTNISQTAEKNLSFFKIFFFKSNSLYGYMCIFTAIILILRFIVRLKRYLSKGNCQICVRVGSLVNTVSKS